MKITKRAQMAPIGIVMVFVSIILLFTLMPAIQEQISGLNVTNEPTLGIIINLIPLLLVLALIISIFIYVTPYRPSG